MSRPSTPRTRRLVGVVALATAVSMPCLAGPAVAAPRRPAPPGQQPPTKPLPPKCDPDDPTAPGDCPVKPKVTTEMIVVHNQNTGKREVFGPVEVIRSPIRFTIYVGPDQHKTQIVKNLDHPCAFYRTYSGKRMWDYPAPDKFKGDPWNYTHSHWIYDSPHPATGAKFRYLQLPDGIGLIEPDWIYSYSLTPGEHYNSPIHLYAAKQVWPHRHQTNAYWWNYNCDYPHYRGIDHIKRTPQWLKAKLKKLHQQQPHFWEYWVTGQEDPPPVPPPFDNPVQLVMASLVNPAIGFAPPPESGETQVRTWVWDKFLQQKYPVTAVSGGMRATAVPTTLKIVSPDAPKNDLTCTGGGKKWKPGSAPGDTDCWIQFATSTPPGTVTKVTFQQSWRIMVNGKYLTGPHSTVRRSSTYKFVVHQTQAAGGN